ncbi:helix-turn-helix domain-containing protein [Corynebacterium uterequi]|uniref:helix-turn-helix domain-containing protein n=1 Tax=Corynebacterium uterequi TaxID=1072256 RepID=UPI000AF1DFFD|nr:helix-turn-helix domain-containing protein [Corynebacterium uterequi]
MTKRVEPIDPKIRLAIASWPEDAERGAVSAFCAAHGISRQTFYRLPSRAVSEGPNAILEPKSRRPHTSPTKLDEAINDHAAA